MKSKFVSLAIPVICVLALAAVALEFIPMLKMTSALAARLAIY